MSPKKVILFADGGARGNPGPAGAGAYLEDEKGHPLAKIHRYLGETTNNVAEYSALILGLKKACELGAREILVRLDSELAIRQLKGIYRVKQPHLQKLYDHAMDLLQKFQKYELEHIPREQNREADRLANRAMDEGPLEE